MRPPAGFRGTALRPELLGLELVPPGAAGTRGGHVEPGNEQPQVWYLLGAVALCCLAVTWGHRPSWVQGGGAVPRWQLAEGAEQTHRSPAGQSTPRAALNPAWLRTRWEHPVPLAAQDSAAATSLQLAFLCAKNTCFCLTQCLCLAWWGGVTQQRDGAWVPDGGRDVLSVAPGAVVCPGLGARGSGLGNAGVTLHSSSWDNAAARSQLHTSPSPLSHIREDLGPLFVLQPRAILGA